MKTTRQREGLVLVLVVAALLVGAAPAFSQFPGGGGGRPTGIVATPPVVSTAQPLTRPALVGSCPNSFVACTPFPWPGDLLKRLDVFGRGRAVPETGGASVPPDVVETTDEGTGVTQVTSREAGEVLLTNGLILGPYSSIEWGRRILSGYVVRDGVRYRADGSVENLTDREVRLEESAARGATSTIVLGPRARINSDGILVAGYVVIGAQRYDAVR